MFKVLLDQIIMEDDVFNTIKIFNIALHALEMILEHRTKITLHPQPSHIHFAEKFT